MFLALATLGSIPVETCHRRVMKDDRVLRDLELYAADLPAGLLRVASLPELVWKRFALVIDAELHWRTFRSDAQLAAATAAGFVEAEVFAVLRGDPFWLT